MALSLKDSHNPSPPYFEIKLKFRGGSGRWVGGVDCLFKSDYVKLYWVLGSPAGLGHRRYRSLKVE